MYLASSVIGSLSCGMTSLARFRQISEFPLQDGVGPEWSTALESECGGEVLGRLVVSSLLLVQTAKVVPRFVLVRLEEEELEEG